MRLPTETFSQILQQNASLGVPSSKQITLLIWISCFIDVLRIKFLYVSTLITAYIQMVFGRLSSHTFSKRINDIKLQKATHNRTFVMIMTFSSSTAFADRCKRKTHHKHIHTETDAYKYRMLSMMRTIIIIYQCYKCVFFTFLDP